MVPKIAHDCAPVLVEDEPRAEALVDGLVGRPVLDPRSAMGLCPHRREAARLTPVEGEVLEELLLRYRLRALGAAVSVGSSG